MTSPAVDVCVIGGGPAGALAALELARLGFSVCLVHRPRARSHWPETAPAILSALFERLGLANVLADATVTVVSEKWLAWPGEELFRIPKPGGVIVRRDRLDDGLRNAARCAGVQIIKANAGSPTRDANASWYVPLGPGRDNGMRARFVVIATGRSGLRRTVSSAEKMVAYYGTLPPGCLPVGIMVVGSGTGHWYWGSSLPDAYHVLVFKKPRQLDCPSSRDALFASSLPRQFDRAIAPVFVGAADATPRTANQSGGDSWIRVGDALLSVDPLASNGLYIATLTAVQSARVINTLAHRPTDTQGALGFYAETQQDIAASCASVATDFYTGGPRSVSEPENSFGHAHYRGMKSLTYMLAPKVRFESVSVLVGDFILTMPGVARDAKRPLAMVMGVPIGRLLEPMVAGKTLKEAAQQWTEFSETDRAKLADALIREGLVVPSACF
ncbi:NAD(P)/FAD-dependent oxidoreductase [Mesorhizobium sp. BR1-1-14]|uniref:NAD(P)/FAD-dependent oxidoreductase n=1 Tax=Mesorhizobium sp. BR1-1-14 TaxID=2876655 RepID=UPI001CD0FA95|nr:FAD-dependent monooxygenase [Mesorhizobium sp. BR1-1-14]MBZ9959320.1 FAD-dependent monooxygenase [Mesorhizobium sp. BR1-1-14]